MLAGNRWTLLHMLHRRQLDAACAFTRWQHFCVKWCYDRHLASDVKSKIRLHHSMLIAYSLEEQSCQISSRSELKRRSLWLLKSVAPTRTTRWVANYGISSRSKKILTSRTYPYNLNQLVFARFEKWSVEVGGRTVVPFVTWYSNSLSKMEFVWIRC